MTVKIIGASDEQVDVFNEVWYSMLLNSGDAMKGKVSNFSLIFQTHQLSSTVINVNNTAIGVIEKRIGKRDGIPFLWRLLVCLALSLNLREQCL